jgi:hypothetical protein
VQIAHCVTRLSDRPGTEYQTCVTIPGPLYQVSYCCHDPHRYSPCRTSHLHTMRQANVILQMKQDKGKTIKNVPDSNSNLGKSMTHHNQTKELITWFLKLISESCLEGVNRQWSRKTLNLND